MAVDQTGTINTLYDPLSDLPSDLDPDELAVQVVHAWFKIAMDENHGPAMFRYAWPESPDVQGLANAIRTVQADQAGFFALLATATWEDVPDRVADRYGLHLGDVYDLLKEPLLNVLPHRPTDKERHLMYCRRGLTLAAGVGRSDVVGAAFRTPRGVGLSYPNEHRAGRRRRGAWRPGRLVWQLRTRRYRAVVYWTASVTVFDTVAANGERLVGLPCAETTACYVLVVTALFVLWRRSEATLPIHSITSTRRELRHWATVALVAYRAVLRTDFPSSAEPSRVSDARPAGHPVDIPELSSRTTAG